MAGFNKEDNSIKDVIINRTSIANKEYKTVNIFDTIKNGINIGNASVPETINIFGSSDTKSTTKSSKTQLNEPFDDEDYIFGDNAKKHGQYGGNQSSLIQNKGKFLQDKKIKEIVHKYYPDATTEQIERIFNVINNSCQFMAAVNTIMIATKDMSEDEFQKTFGFQRYTLSFADNGEPYKDYNYEYIFLDFFLHAQKDGLFGSLQGENGEYLDPSDIDNIKNGGGPANWVASALRTYLGKKGINYQFTCGGHDKDGKTLDGNVNKRKKSTTNGLKNYFKKYKNKDNISEDDLKLPDTLDSNLIKELIAAGCQVTIGCEGFSLYLPYDKDGNGKLDDIASAKNGYKYDNVGAHAMYVTGTTSDPNKIIVSSWGEQFVLDISEVQDYTVHDYNPEAN